ncbi:methyltransferase domain-containing protein [Streptomyces microflavus]|uniref:class I SAM-dependent methyltransferase n=1 Tax=Streptomyces microflavus TaxID=1919 RepID=UPI0033C6B7CD
MDEQGWRGYVGGYHDAHPGITERFFGLADSSPYRWLAEPLLGVRGTVLDVACGSAPMRVVLPEAGWAGVDLSAGELAEAARRGRGPVVRAGAEALPVRSGSVTAVCAAMCLPVVTPLPAVLGEVRRVLRPGGVLAALVPSRSGLSPAGALGWARVLYALRSSGQPWPNPQALDGLAAVLRAHGFRVGGDDRRVFRLGIESADAAALLVDALYLPGTAAHRTAAAKRSLARWARPGRRLELPLRRVTAEPVTGNTPPEQP